MIPAYPRKSVQFSIPTVKSIENGFVVLAFLCQLKLTVPCEGSYGLKPYQSVIRLDNLLGSFYFMHNLFDSLSNLPVINLVPRLQQRQVFGVSTGFDFV